MLILSRYWPSKKIVLLLLGVFLLCFEYQFATAGPGTNKSSADILYWQAMKSLQKGHVARTDEILEKISHLYPYSAVGQQALFLQIQLAFKNKDYSRVSSMGDRFLILYPQNTKSVHVRYLIAESLFQQIPAIDFDQDITRKAQLAYENLLQKHSEEDRYTSIAYRRLIELRNQLAAKELSIGRYYLMLENYVPAINRFQFIVQHYPKTNSVEEALGRIVESYSSLGLMHEAKQTATTLGHHNPGSWWYKRSVALLRRLSYKSASPNG